MGTDSRGYQGERKLTRQNEGVARGPVARGRRRGSGRGWGMNEGDIWRLREYLGRGSWEGLRVGSAEQSALPVRGAAVWGQGFPLGPLLPFRTRAGSRTAAAAAATSVHARGRRRCPGAGAEAAAVAGSRACVSASRTDRWAGPTRSPANGRGTGRRGQRLLAARLPSAGGFAVSKTRGLVVVGPSTQATSESCC